MRNKWLITLLIAIFALPMFGSAVLAEETVVYEDGNHSITAKAINADTGEPSGAAGFINEEATLSIVDGEATFIITIPDNEMAEITGLQVEGIEPVVTENEGSRDMAYKLANVKPELNAQVQYEVPSIDLKHDVPFKFVIEGLDDIPVKEEKETTETVNPDEPTNSEEETTDLEEPVVEENEEENTPEVEETVFVEATEDAQHINFVTDSSAVNRQFNNPAVVFDKDGKTFIHLSGTGGQFFNYLAINETEVTWGEIAEDGSFTVQFEHPGSLSDDLVMNMVIQAGPKEMPHDVPFTFDESSLTPITEEEPVEEEPVEEKPAEEPREEEKEEPKTPEKEEEVVSEKVTKVNYQILKEDSDEESNAAAFFTGEATLIEKNGQKYLQIVSTSPQLIESLTSEYGTFKIVKNNADGSAVYQLALPNNFDLADVFVLDMSVSVPGVYEAEHSTRVIFDVEAEDETKKPGLDPNTPEKPTLDDEEDETVVPTTNNDSNSGENALNPQTGENTNIMLYVLLLIGSAIPLAIKAKGHFA